LIDLVAPSFNWQGLVPRLAIAETRRHAMAHLGDAAAR
jgi:hypothetical protein